MSFLVQRRQCETCIYKPASPLDLPALERQIADGYGGFRSFRVCHHSETACCRGFWNRHKDKFTLGQLAQRLRLVRFVDHDTPKEFKDHHAEGPGRPVPEAARAQKRRRPRI